ncbi:hypothetical protein HNR74_000872 [Flammeovirga kamogawensis]|nr:hypothetical protein [Flammeovirga kamogawensis]
MQGITYLEIAAMAFMVPPIVIAIGYALVTFSKDKV